VTQTAGARAGRRHSTPLYPRVLRLRHLHPSAWQRAAYFEGSIAVGAVAALTDQVSAWTPVVMPVAVAVVVKFHDVLTGLIRPAPAVQPYGSTEAVQVMAAPHVVVLRPGSATSDEPVVPTPRAPEPDHDPSGRSVGDATAVESVVEVAESPPDVVDRPAPGPMLASALRTRAELDALADAALSRAAEELSRRGGLEPFVMRLDVGGVPELVPHGEVLDLPGQPGLRAVVVCQDVALPGRAPVDAVRMELEHVDGEPESVVVVYRHTGEGPAIVLTERTRISGRRSGVRRRFFAPTRVGAERD